MFLNEAGERVIREKSDHKWNMTKRTGKRSRDGKERSRREREVETGNRSRDGKERSRREREHEGGS